MSRLEIRTTKDSLGRVQVRKASANMPPALTGYASVFMRFSQNLGGFVEQVDPVAFNKSLADGGPVMARYNHDDNYLLGTTAAGTLTLGVDGTGLRYTVEPPDTSAGRDVMVLATRGDLAHSSFAFQTMPDGDTWSLTEQGMPLRTLTAVQLIDVAPVNNPAYRDATVGLRSLSERVGLPVEAINADHMDEIRKAITGKRTFIDLGAVKPATKRASDADPDDDPGKLAQSLDAVLDSAVAAWAGIDIATLPPEVQQGIALVNGAEALVDELLELLGLADADDLDDSDTPAAPAAGGGSAQRATHAHTAILRMRLELDKLKP